MDRFNLTNGPIIDYGGTLTFSVILTCIMGASDGRFFGYDIVGISGASKIMSATEKFIPSVLRKMVVHGPSVYCMSESPRLTAAFALALYAAGMFACVGASRLGMRLGPQVLLLGAVFFFLGGFLNAAALNC